MRSRLVNLDQKDYEFDRIIMDYEQGLKDMVHYLLDVKEYREVNILYIYERRMVHGSVPTA